MKKILSMVLCILMVASVFAIPMTASAATTSSEAVFDPTTTNNYVVEYDGMDAYRYQWTPASDGVLTLSGEPGCNDIRVLVENANVWSDYVAFEYCPDAGFSDASATYNVTAGTLYNVIINTYTMDAGTVDFWAYFEAGSGSGITGSGSMIDPYQISETTEALPEIASGETAYFQLSVSDLTKTYNFMFIGSMMGSYEVSLNRQTYYPMMMGRTTIENVTPDMYWGNISFTVTNTGRGPETIGLTVTANEASTLGTMENPDTLVFDTITTSTISDGSYYYTASMDEDGTLSVEFLIVLDDWMCTIYGGEAELVFASSNDDPVTNPVTYPVKAGEEITVIVSNNDLEACELYFKATLVTDDDEPTEPDEPVGPEHTYHVAGVPALCGFEWNPAENQMMYFGDGTWSITFENVPAGNHEFKVVEDGAWGNPDFNLEGRANDAGNAVVTVEVDGSTVTIGFDGEKAYIEFVVAPENPPATEDEKPVDPETPATEDEKPVDPETPATEDEKPVDPETPATDDEQKPSTDDEQKPSTDDEQKPSSGDEATKDEYELGDVNRDGSLNIKDVTAIQKYLAKLIEFDEQQVELANYNGDKKVSIQDATTIQKKLAHLI